MESETLREVTTSLDDGKYCLVSTLKEGRLYLAEKAGKRYVLKTSPGIRGLELLKREYEISHRLQHPFIAATIAWEEDTPAGAAIVMEYIRGRSLAEYLKEKPSRQARERIFGQLLEAIGAIHRQSITHNDIKPENILITEVDDDVKLIDFGFADGDVYALQKGLGGTRQYASPELLAHRDTDARSDIYSIGLLMRDIFPGRYRRIARKCCKLKPDQRYRTIDNLKNAWEHRHRPLWIGIFLLIVTLAIGAYALLNTVYESGFSAAEATLRQAWEESYDNVCEEMDRVPYREFLPIHLDYGTYEISPVINEVSSRLSDDELQAIISLNDALEQDYSQRLYAKYGSLPSLYDKSLDLPEAELSYYRNLAHNFNKFSPYTEKNIE